ncbi:MAG TPA: hypothetical protein PLV50_08165 [Smithella sp.]|nr:hypothetical protein [Smithella sp.]HNY49969.1 hypothetical protein [Smithella sp.]HOG90497.1 hypothetical protein [Smithella sp.]HQG66026.1 hypothetical protein [Smithella sp.]HQI23653.1 hypothetical protein [Smithella sp.]
MLPKSFKEWLLILLIILTSGYFIYEKMEQRRIAVIGPVEEQPVQESTNIPSLQRDDYDIQPVARYALRAKVLSAERYRMGRMSDLSPLDLALGWGPMSRNDVIEKLDIRQGNRWYYYRWEGTPPISPADIIRSSANTHLVPASDSVKSRLLKVRTGEIVKLKGYLINIKHRDGWTWNTSLTREDSGAGSCELMWVEEAFIEN